VRYAPRQTQLGRIFPRHPVGQGFTCERDGLSAIEVAMVRLAGEARPIDLELRVQSPDGPVLRRARAEAADLPSSDGWARFEFDPVPDSRGVRFYLSLAAAGDAPSSHAPWIRYRGAPRVVRPWGSRVAPREALAGEFQSLDPDLRALAFAVDGFDAAAAPGEIEVECDGEPARRSQLAPRAPLADGWAFFAFEPIAASRWKGVRYRLSVPESARFVGGEGGLSLIAFHGSGAADPRLAGITWRGEVLADRDLVFRAWSGEGTRALVSRLADRVGATFLFALAAWLAAIALAVRAFGATARPS
jgi:hypothetical protein